MIRDIMLPFPETLVYGNCLDCGAVIFGAISVVFMHEGAQTMALIVKDAQGRQHPIARTVRGSVVVHQVDVINMSKAHDA